MIISVGVAALVGVPVGCGLASFTELGATGMWIANLAYATLNSLLMVGWLLMGRWARAQGSTRAGDSPGRAQRRLGGPSRVSSSAFSTPARVACSMSS